MATHSNILAWETSWTKEPGGLHSMGSQRVRHDSVTKLPPGLHGAERNTTPAKFLNMGTCPYLTQKI